MHRHTGGFVDGQHPFVLEQHRKLARRHRRGLFFGRFLGHPHWRQPHHVTQLQPGVGADATPVDTHLPAADDAVDVGLGNPFEDAHQEVVEALAGTVFIHRDLLDRRGHRVVRAGWIGPYNVFH